MFRFGPRLIYLDQVRRRYSNRSLTSREYGSAHPVPEIVADIMSMQNITGHYALPLERPFSNVPPPYGRRRTPFVKSGRPGPSVFDLRVACAQGGREATTHAVDFGSENRTWLTVGPPRRRLRRALLASLPFAAFCMFATHMVDTRRNAA